jgi:DNA-binding response OmpR family regulator
MVNLLIVSREKERPVSLRDKLARAGLSCSVTPYHNGSRGAFAGPPPDVILLELTGRRSDEDTLGLIRGMKRERKLPVIAIVPPERLDEMASDADFDDFLTSPPDPAELGLRIKRLLGKRRDKPPGELISHNGLVIDPAACEVTLDGRAVELTFKEYELLKLLAGHRGRVFTRDDLLNRLWGYDYFGGDRTVDVHIRRLRSKIEDAGHTFIETVRNIGYRFVK